MNDITRPAQISLYELARQDAKHRAEETLLILHEHEAEAARFEAMCDALRGHGLKFGAEIYCSEQGMQYWICLYKPEETALCGEMMLALCGLGCEKIDAFHREITSYEIHRLTSDSVPTINLAINREREKPAAEASHAEPLAA